MWAVTSAGRRLIARDRRRAWALLPESPQHRSWREAHELAERQLDPLVAQLRGVIASTVALIDEDTHDYSAFVSAGRELRNACWSVGGAMYCLFEWAEPEDGRADVDDRHDSAGLRNPVSWCH